eukprot:4812101-Pyramimonas_sp.AAC.1
MTWRATLCRALLRHAVPCCANKSQNGEYPCWSPVQKDPFLGPFWLKARPSKGYLPARPSAGSLPPVGMPERCRRRFRGKQYEVRVPTGRLHDWAEARLRQARTVTGMRKALRDIRARVRAARSRAYAESALKAASARHWHVVQRTSGGPVRPKAGARVIVSVARRNSGRGQSVHGRKLSLALCHGPLRRACRKDDLLVVVTGKPSPRMRPAAFLDAVEGLNGERALVAACLADKVYPAVQYYTKVGLGRPDCWYRKARKGDKKQYVDAKGNAFALRT